MSKTILKARIIGHVGNVRDHVTGSGDKILNLSVAHNGKSRGDEYTEWVEVTLFGRLAEAVEPYVEKGTAVYAEGDARVRTYDTKDGETKAILSVTAREFLLLPSAITNTAGNPRKQSRQRDAFEDNNDPW